MKTIRNKVAISSLYTYGSFLISVSSDDEQYKGSDTYGRYCRREEKRIIRDQSLWKKNHAVFNILSGCWVL